MAEQHPSIDIIATPKKVCFSVSDDGTMLQELSQHLHPFCHSSIAYKKRLLNRNASQLFVSPLFFQHFISCLLLCTTFSSVVSKKHSSRFYAATVCMYHTPYEYCTCWSMRQTLSTYTVCTLYMWRNLSNALISLAACSLASKRSFAM